MIEIPIGRGLAAVIDDDDLLLVDNRRWYAMKSKYTTYAYSTSKPTIYMHRLILDAKPGQVVDHIDGNGLNNTRDNIRLCTQRQNIQRSVKRKIRTSAYKGVYRHRDKWSVAIIVNGVNKHLGTFRDEADAARAYDQAALSEFGEFASLNFTIHQPSPVAALVGKGKR